MKKSLALLLCVFMLLALLSGCGGSEPAASEAPSAAPEEAAPASEAPADGSAPAEPEPAASEEAPAEYQFHPFAENETISYFDSVNPTVEITYEQSQYYARLAELGNFTWEFKLIAMTTATEQFNLLAAAGDLPDVLGTSSYSNSDTQAVEEEIYRDIAPLIEEYAPDFYKMVQQTDVARLSMYTDEGYMTNMSLIAAEEFPPNNGTLVRQDIIDADFGGVLPKTYDEYHDYLVVCRDEYDMSSPMYLTMGGLTLLSGGFGLRMGGFSLNEDGELVYSILNDNCKDFLKLMKDWVAEGLIYPDFYAEDTGGLVDKQNELVANEQCGAFYCWVEFASYIGFSDGSKAVIGPSHMPRLNADDQVHISDGVDTIVRDAWWFSGNCSDEKLEVLLNVLNYFYTDEGSLLANWGEEGVTYEVQEDGSFWYTDLITNNPDGMTINEALQYYLAYWSPHASDLTKFNIAMMTTYAGYSDIWASADNDYNPPSYSMTTEEADASSAVSSDISTLTDETLVKFILGELNFESDWDAFIDQLYTVGLQDYLDANTAAYERYMSK